MVGQHSFRRQLIIDRIFRSLIFLFSLLLMLPLLFILTYIFQKGIHAFCLDFFLNLPKPVGESGGGVSNAIVGSLYLIGLSCLFSIPTGVLTGVYLAENRRSRLAECIRISIDTLQGIPSIVTGIIAYLWIVVPMGHFSVLSGGLALAFMMFPLIAKPTEETLRLVPSSIKEAAYGLGASYYQTLFYVVIPSARQGILSGILLGVARVSGETAPLLFTAFGNPFMSTSLTKPVHALPLLIFNYATSPYDDWQQMAWGASLLLILFVLTLSLLSKYIAKR